MFYELAKSVGNVKKREKKYFKKIAKIVVRYVLFWGQLTLIKVKVVNISHQIGKSLLQGNQNLDNICTTTAADINKMAL
jgi:hypothetical protein